MSQLLLVDVPAVVHPPGESDEFYTPRPLFAKWHDEFKFTVDACATRESACVPRFYDFKADGLVQKYAGERVWCNPPFSDIGPWIHLAQAWMQTGKCESWVHLLPANRTEQPWWQGYIEWVRDRPPNPGINYTLETRFLRGRFKFGFPGDPTGESGQSPTFGCVLVVWLRVP